MDEIKDWRILAYLKQAGANLAETIEQSEDREELIDSVMKLRQIKRAELTCKEIIKKNDNLK
tara:strand:+ start:335 stop:520 length:186 start_codon:yes stop_codon:yes gene_type:complete